MRVLVFQDRLASLGNTGRAQRASAGGSPGPPRGFSIDLAKGLMRVDRHPRSRLVISVSNARR